jgi:hypothetical protein
MRASNLTITVFAVVVVLLCATASAHGSDAIGLQAGDTLRMYFKYSHRNTVDTFTGVLVKDLICDGLATTPFSLTPAEQDSILRKAEASGFFFFPDTIPRLVGVKRLPDAGPQMLRLKVDGRDHTVVWHRPLDFNTPWAKSCVDLARYIWSIIGETTAFRALPPARGGYL